MKDIFTRDFQYDITHISLVKAVALILIALAMANLISNLAYGIEDDMLTTVLVTAWCKKLVVSAMNTTILKKLIIQDNLSILTGYDFSIITTDSGWTARIPTLTNRNSGRVGCAITRETMLWGCRSL